jgi:hypothetical protein
MVEIRVGDGTSIEIPPLMALGDDVSEVGTRLARVASDIERWRGTASGAVEGSVTCTVQLGLMADHWHSSLGLLARSIQDYGRSLHRAAADYRTADQAAGKMIGQAGAALAARMPGSGGGGSGGDVPR